MSNTALPPGKGLMAQVMWAIAFILTGIFIGVLLLGIEPTDCAPLSYYPPPVNITQAEEEAPEEEQLVTQENPEPVIVATPAEPTPVIAPVAKVEPKLSEPICRIMGLCDIPRGCSNALLALGLCGLEN